MNLMGENDTKKKYSNINSKYRVAISTQGSKERRVITGESRKISSCLTDLGLRMEKT